MIFLSLLVQNHSVGRVLLKRETRLKVNSLKKESSKFIYHRHRTTCLEDEELIAVCEGAG
jgi:hypothetical protein